MLRKKSISPFDEVVTKQIDDIQENISVNDVRYLSMRAAIFMVSIIISLCGILTRSSDVLIMSGIVVTYLFVWGAVMRIWQTSTTIMANALVNILVAGIFFGVAQFVGANIEYDEFSSLLTVVAGVTALGSINKDYTKRYSIIGFVEEFLIPSLLAIVSVSVASVSFLITDRNSLGNMLILSAVALGGFSLLLKLVLKITYSFSSRQIIDYTSFPVANRANLIVFYKERAFFGICVLIAFVISYFSNILIEKYLLDINVCFKLIIPVAAAIVFIIAGLIFKKSDNPIFIFEAFGALYFLMYPISVNLIAAIMLDVILVGYLVTYKRRSIRAVKSVHIEGVPLMIIVLGVLSLCVEALPL